MRSRKDGYRYVGAARAPKAVQRVKGRIRQMLAPANQAPWDEVVQALNLVLRGWRQYFAYGTRLRAYRSVDRYVVGRVRRFLRRRHKVRSRETRRYSLDMLYGSLGGYRLEDRPQWPPANVGV